MIVCRAILPQPVSRNIVANRFDYLFALDTTPSSFVEWPRIQDTSDLDGQSDDVNSPWLLLGTGLDSATCRKNPKVQRAVSELARWRHLYRVQHLTLGQNLGLTLIMGILSALTAGFWGSLSDRKGRRPVLSMTQLGFLFADCVFLAVVTFNHVLPYRLLFLGPAIDGLFGGFACA
jgi:MFS family permease